ncbi:universal stress protein [Apilactobacillus xinyiensis]|uniref:universal stress protein n=1 Tax=Apilactobacillus xinyiensis TaxID=2841032 RepID=UPI001C7CA711|nr:universal stress protein [Apilactobacillus xinyiensis]MCL0318267.1 universal stress protein [Apilactobacillus xinyiensis]MCL0330035.1 universal stress protein [Apilactobacillus xinyiensis]
MLQDYNNILVPIDGSKNAELAFNKALEVAKRNKANLHLVHVVDERAFQNLSSFDAKMIEELTDSSKKTLEKYLKKAKDFGLSDTDYSIEYGSPKVVIAKDVVNKLNIDLVMMGATGLNSVERFLIGSVTSFVTRVAKCDVLIVKTDLENK